MNDIITYSVDWPGWATAWIIIFAVVGLGLTSMVLIGSYLSNDFSFGLLAALLIIIASGAFGFLTSSYAIKGSGQEATQQAVEQQGYTHFNWVQGDQFTVADEHGQLLEGEYAVKDWTGTAVVRPPVLHPSDVNGGQ